jgi:hypothetical protein
MSPKTVENKIFLMSCKILVTGRSGGGTAHRAQPEANSSNLRTCCVRAHDIRTFVTAAFITPTASRHLRVPRVLRALCKDAVGVCKRLGVLGQQQLVCACVGGLSRGYKLGGCTALACDAGFVWVVTRRHDTARNVRELITLALKTPCAHELAPQHPARRCSPA